MGEGDGVGGAMGHAVQQMRAAMARVLLAAAVDTHPHPCRRCPALPSPTYPQRHARSGRSRSGAQHQSWQQSSWVSGGDGWVEVDSGGAGLLPVCPLGVNAGQAAATAACCQSLVLCALPRLARAAEEWPDTAEIKAARRAEEEAKTPIPERCWALRNVAGGCTSEGAGCDSAGGERGRLSEEAGMQGGGGGALHKRCATACLPACLPALPQPQCRLTGAALLAALLPAGTLSMGGAGERARARKLLEQAVLLKQQFAGAPDHPGGAGWEGGIVRRCRRCSDVSRWATWCMLSGASMPNALSADLMPCLRSVPCTPGRCAARAAAAGGAAGRRPRVAAGRGGRGSAGAGLPQPCGSGVPCAGRRAVGGHPSGGGAAQVSGGCWGGCGGCGRRARGRRAVLCSFAGA